MNLERSIRTNQDRPAIRFPRKSARSNLARCVRERSWDDVQWCSEGKVVERPWQECHDVLRCSSRIHRLYKSLFKNAPLLTFLSADLFPIKHARNVSDQVSKLVPRQKCYSEPREDLDVPYEVPSKQYTQVPRLETSSKRGMYLYSSSEI